MRATKHEIALGKQRMPAGQRRRHVVSMLVVMALVPVSACGGGGGSAGTGTSQESQAECAGHFPRTRAPRRAQPAAQLSAFTDRLAAAAEAPDGATAEELYQQLQREGVRSLDDNQTVDAFYDALHAEDLRKAPDWAGSSEGAALTWFAPSASNVNALLGMSDAFAVAETVNPSAATLTVVDRDGAPRWRVRVPLADAHPHGESRDLIRLHAVGDRLIAVVVNAYDTNKAAARAIVRLVSLDAATGRVRACRTEVLDAAGLPYSVGALVQDSAVDVTAGTVVIDVPAAPGARIEAFDARTLRHRWSARVDRRLRAVEAGHGIVVAARDPNFVQQDHGGELAGPQLAVFDGRSGRPRWRLDHPPPGLQPALRKQGVTVTSPAITRDRVLVIADSPVITSPAPAQALAFDAATGRPAWTSGPLRPADQYTDLALVGGRAVVSTNGETTAQMRVLDPTNGAVVGGGPAEVDLRNPPVLVGAGRALASDVGATFIPLDRAGGQPRAMRLDEWYAASKQAASGNVVLLWDASSALLLALRADHLPG